MLTISKKTFFFITIPIFYIGVPTVFKNQKQKAYPNTTLVFH